MAATINTPATACATADRIVDGEFRGDDPSCWRSDTNFPCPTASSVARDAYVQGCEAKLTMYPGALEGFERAIAADPVFALAHAARAHVLLERGDAAAARRRWRRPIPSPPVCPSGKRAISHFFDLLSAGDAEAALSALPAHLDAPIASRF